MIDVKDLRIGNWVYDGERTQFPMFVRTIGEDYVYLDFEGNEGDLWESTLDDVSGIPITEELLEKIKFERSDMGTWQLVKDHRHIGYHLPSGFVAMERYEDSGCVSRSTCLNVRYVHELQNLYRCIVRDELQISL